MRWVVLLVPLRLVLFVSLPPKGGGNGAIGAPVAPQAGW